MSELHCWVTDYVSGNYTGYKISEASKMEEADSKKVNCEAEIQKDKEEMDLLFYATVSVLTPKLKLTWIKTKIKS